MKTLGLIGSIDRNLPSIYWRTLNNEVRLRLGGIHTAPFLMHSPDAEELDRLLRRGDWTGLTQMLIARGHTLASAGVDGLAICGSALNPIAHEVGRETGLRIVCMGHAISATLQMFRYRRVVIAGTRTTREDRMWSDALHEFHVMEFAEEEKTWLSSIARRDEGDADTGLQAATNQIIHGHRRRGAQAIMLARGGCSTRSCRLERGSKCSRRMPA